MKYTVDYFISKFESIPSKKWTTGNFTDRGKHCALGHCGYGSHGPVESLEEGDELHILFKHYGLYVTRVNDGRFDDDGFKWNKAGKTPKERILNVLYTIKAGVLG